MSGGRNISIKLLCESSSGGFYVSKRWEEVKVHR
jgi:hypothetical protein